MKKMMIALLLLLAPLSSHALMEIRAGYGIQNLDDTTYASVVKIDNGKGFNFDFLFKPPLITNLGLGLRYEQIKFDTTLTVAPFTGDTFTAKRFAALVNYRLIDTFFYLGPIVSIGLNTSFDSSSSSSTDTKAKFNWSAGAEGGVHLGLISVGAEVGKFFGKATITGQPDLNLDGLYAKILVGFGF